MSASRPSTPLRTTGTLSTPVGKWKHPQLNEIYRRQNASTFSDRNLKRVLFNVGGLITIFAISRVLWKYFPSLFSYDRALHSYATWIYHGFQILFVFNIFSACWPLVRGKDDLADIPLTPGQRQLLGLPPSSKHATPDTKYVTPPRYARTPTPLSASPTGRRSFSNSPLGGKSSPLASSLGTSFSPTASPLLQKAIGGSGLGGTRRASYGSPSPLSPAVSKSSTSDGLGSPKLAGKGPSVGINNRWLFDKARRNSGNSRLCL